MNFLKAECSIQETEEKWNQKIGALPSNNLKRALPKVSVNVMVKNEERCIERCLRSMDDFADEIIIVDTGSKDRTLEIIQSFDRSLPVFHKEWKDDFAEIRNFMMTVSSHDWIMHLDADETLSEDFSKVKNLLAMCEDHPEEQFYFINPKIQNSNGLIYTLTHRIFPKYLTNEYIGIIHEELRVNSHPEAKVVDLFVDGTLYHDGYQAAIMQQKNKLHRNVNALEIMIEREPKNPRWTYFLARDAYNGLEQLNEYTIDHVKTLLYETTRMNTSYPQMWEFIEGAYVLLEEILCQEENWDTLKHWNNELKERFPKNADSYYFELLLNQRNAYSNQEQFLQGIFQQLKEKDATISRIDSDLSHLLYALAYSHFEIGDMKHTAFFLEELSSEMQQLFVDAQQDKVNSLQQMLHAD